MNAKRSPWDDKRVGTLKDDPETTVYRCPNGFLYWTKPCKAHVGQSQVDFILDKHSGS